MKSTIIASIGICTILAFSGTGCSGRKDKNSAQDSAYTIPDSIDMVQAIGRIQPLDGTIDVSAEVDGIIEKVLVRNGDSVKSGDILFIIDPSIRQLDLKVARQKLAQEKANLELASIDIEKSELALKKAQEDYNITQRLVKKGADTRQNLLDQKNDLNTKKLALAESLKKKTASQENLKELQENVRIAEKNLSKCEVRTLQDAIVLDVSAVAGNTIKAYDKALTLCPDEPIIVEAEVEELFANRVEQGDKVKIHNVGYDRVIATGKVIHLSNFLTKKSLFSGLNNEQQDTQVRKIKILLDDQSHYPLIGSKVTCDIQTTPNKNK